MANKMQELYRVLNYTFKDPELLQTALTHRSIRGKNNERLEFLGDSIVNYLIAEAVFHQFPKAREGRLSRIRANLVNGDSLAEMAETLFNLSDYIIMGPGELKSGGHKRPSVLADCLEAIIAAIYIDGGTEAARRWVFHWFSERIAAAEHIQTHKDPKTLLQEWSQAKKLGLPNYEIINIEGQAHRQTFIVECRIPELSLVAKGSGSSRRRAEQDAARDFLEQLEHATT